MVTLDPVWLVRAKSYQGLKEIPGPKHNSKILDWLAKLGAWWKDDETAWCGTFVAHCVQESGLPIPTHWYRAKAWSNYGSLLRRERLAPGAILIFDRQGGGHVGFYVGEDISHYHVLGGNQSNGVNITRIAKSRCVASRWPKDQPVLAGPVKLTSAGVAVSTNEA